MIKFGQDKALQSLNSKEKRNYLSKRKENLLHLSKVALKKFLRQILTSKSKEDNKIALKDWNSYLKMLYESSDTRDNIQTLLTTEEVFSLEDIYFRVKCLANGKAKDIEGYQAEILKIGGSVFIPHIHKLFNLVLKQGFHTPWTQSLIIPIFKSGDKNDPSNYHTIMIIPLLAKLYGIILEKNING